MNEKDGCDSAFHNFVILSKDYFKRSAADIIGYDQEIAYSTLYCTKCGLIKEVISRQLKEDSHAH